MIYSANAPMDFESANNIRELGGYINGDGIPLKKHVLLRGGDLSLLTEKEVGRLEAYGIKTSIDLRISKEKKASDPFNESNHLVYYAIPIAGAVDTACAPKDLLYTLYVDILENHKEALRREIRIIAGESEGIIFHCTAGKDRTGVTAMLILAVCGVCEDQIIADYASSGDNNRAVTMRQLAQLKDSGITDIPMEIFESDPDTMRRTLDYLNERYGGPVNYMKTIGVTGEEMQKIREKMLEAQYG